MKVRFFAAAALTAGFVVLTACESGKQTLQSPDGKIAVVFDVDKEGAPIYSVSFDGRTVINPSGMGFVFKDFSAISGFRLEDVNHSEVRDKWTPVWGENAEIEDNYNAMTINLVKDVDGRAFEMAIDFRAYDDGVGFRYRFPASDGDSLTVVDEVTRFAMM